MKMSLNTTFPGAQGAATTRLDALPVGKQARLGAALLTTPTVLRLIEMGLVEGVTVRMTRRAPLGDPLEVAIVGGPRLCLRREDARAFSLAAVAP